MYGRKGVGLATQGNYSTAGQTAAPPKEPETLSTMLTALDREVGHANSVLARAMEVADALLGGVPRAVDEPKDVAEASNLVLRFKMRQQRLYTVLTQIDEQVARIGNAI
jgi:hypothetical protein